MPSHFFVFFDSKGKSPELYLAERRSVISGNLRLKSNKRNVSVLFDQNE